MDERKQARAASPPLSPSSQAARDQRLMFILDGQDAVADAKTAVHAEIEQSARRFAGDDFEMVGLRRE